jgi:hypothetical protein
MKQEEKRLKHHITNNGKGFITFVSTLVICGLWRRSDFCNYSLVHSQIRYTSPQLTTSYIPVYDKNETKDQQTSLQTLHIKRS